MGQAKPWQIVLIVLAALVSTGSVAWMLFGQEKIQMGTRIEMVDVVTGDRWWIDVRGSKRGTFPAKHPDTGLRTLVRAHEEDGVWTSDEIYSASNFADRSTFSGVASFEKRTLNISDAPIKQYKPGGG